MAIRAIAEGFSIVLAVVLTSIAAFYWISRTDSHHSSKSHCNENDDVSDTGEKMKQLEMLWNDGLITEEEYLSKRAYLLAKL